MALPRHIHALVIAVAVLAVIGYRVAGPGNEKPADAGKAVAKNAGQGVPVRLAEVAIRDVERRIELTGRTEADASVTLRSRVEGQVQAVPMAEGRFVRQGELLIQLDPADLRARLAQAEANRAKSRSQAAKARADLQRYVGLREKGFVSEEKVADLRTALSAAESVEQADAAAVEVARLQLSYTAIRAPFAGVVGARLVSPGASVKTNDTALATINRVQPLRIAFAVPEKYLPQLRERMRDGELTAQVGRPSGAPLVARVDFLDNAVDVGSGTLAVKATLPNTDQTLAAGQFVTVALTLETLRKVATVPAEAVQHGSEGAFVFVANGDKVALRKVAVTAMQEGVAAVAEGLVPGEKVVTEGHLRLTDGARYREAGSEEKTGKGAGARKGDEASVEGGGPGGDAPPKR